MAHIDYYFGTLSSWSYIAGNRLEEIAARHGASITYKPLDLMTLFDRTGGTRPLARHPSRTEYRNQDLRRWAERLGMPINPRPTFWPTNAAPSSYAIIAAQKAGGGDVGKLVQSFLRAIWAEELDISDDQVIRDRLAAAGFDPGIADSGLLIGAQTYERNLDEALEAGVFGAPFYVVRDSGERFWGQDRLEMLDGHLAKP